MVADEALVVFDGYEIIMKLKSWSVQNGASLRSIFIHKSAYTLAKFVNLRHEKINKPTSFVAQLLYAPARSETSLNPAGIRKKMPLSDGNRLNKLVKFSIVLFLKNIS